MKKIAIVVSSPMMVNFFLIAQLNHLVENFEVTLITGPPDNNVGLQKENLNKKAKVHFWGGRGGTFKCPSPFPDQRYIFRSTKSVKKRYIFPTRSKKNRLRRKSGHPQSEHRN